MARPRRSHSGARERLRSHLEDLVRLYGDEDDRTWRRQIADLDAGKPVRCHAYEVDLTPSNAYLEIDRQGQVPLLR